MFEAEISFSKFGDAAASAAANDKKLVEYGLETQTETKSGEVIKKGRPADSKFNTYTYNGMTYTEE
jgi:hypothetical protein